MCNYCNVTASTSACGSKSYGCQNGFWYACSQRLCRDVCGNIHVTQCGSSCNGCNNGCSNDCGCNNGCSNNCGCVCNNNCGCYATNAQTNGASYVSNCGNAATAQAGDYYYARQYGLSSGGYSSPCSVSNFYNYDTQTV